MFRKCLQSSTPLLSYQQMGLRVRVAREINYNFENERKQYRLDMKVYRKKHLEEYWNT